MNDTIHLGEAKPWRVIPTLDEFLPGGFKFRAMATVRAEEFDKPAGLCVSTLRYSAVLRSGWRYGG